MADLKIDLSLHPAQLDVFQDPRRFKVAVAGRRFGKSWLAAAVTVTKALDEGNVQKLPVAVVAPTFPVAKRSYWSRLMKHLHPVIESSNSNDGVIKLINGIEIHVVGADRPDSLRGPGYFHVTLDEYATMKPEVWEQVIRPTLADCEGTALFIGSPSGRNHFYHLVQAAKLDTTGEWAVWEFKTSDNPYISRKEIESARRDMSSAAFRQEMEGSFEAGGTNTFLREWFRYGKEPKEGQWYIAVDLAGFTDGAEAQVKSKRLDETAIAVVKVHENGWWVKTIKHGRWGARETAEHVALLCAKYQPAGLGVEKGALKQAVEQYLRVALWMHNVSVLIQPLTHANQTKANRIVWALQGRFEHGRIELNEDEDWKDLEDQLIHFPSRTVHDDLVDALAYIEQIATVAAAQIEDYEVTYSECVDIVAGY